MNVKDVGDDCPEPECRGEMQFVDPKPSRGSKLVCSSLACDFEATYQGDFSKN